MEKFVLGSFCLLSMVLLGFADDITDEELLKKLLSDSSRIKLRDLVDEYLLEEDNAAKIDSLLNPGERRVNVPKRIFCNGNAGCFNAIRRSLEEDNDSSNLPIIRKRPFCNGFFGCQNGKKRSFSAPVVPTVSMDTSKAEQKRLFCNLYGCGNHGKRSSLYSKLLGRLERVPEDKSLNI